MRRSTTRIMVFMSAFACMLLCVGCNPIRLVEYVTEITNEDTYDDDYSDYTEEDDSFYVDDYEEDDTDVDDYEEDNTDVDDYMYNDDTFEEDYEGEEDVDFFDALEVPESVITDYEWKAYNDGSLIVCETDTTFRYYQSDEDMTDNYYEGTYEFYVGAEAVEYVTTVLSEFAVTEEELEDLFERSDEHDESNFVCLVLHNETCIVDGENTMDEAYDRPYYGSCTMVDGAWTLNIVNMNTANLHCFTAQ